MKTLGKSVVVVFAMIGVVLSLQQLRGQSASPLAGATYGHIGIVVKDLNTTIPLYEEVFAIKIPPPKEFGPLEFPMEVPGSANSKVKVAAFNLGGLNVELIQPISGPGPYPEYLNRFGQGIQHIAFAVKDSKAAIRYLQSKGGTWTMSAHVNLKEQLGFSAEVRAPQSPPAR